MAHAPNARVSLGVKKTWVSVGMVGVVAITAGVLLPRLLASVAPLPETTAAVETGPKNALAYAPPSWPDGPDPKAMLLRLGLGTAIVLGLCVGTLWFCRRWLRGVPVKNPVGSQLRLVEALVLANRCAVYLVQVGNRQVLVGADGSGLKTLVPLPEPFEMTLSEVQAREAAPVGSAVDLTENDEVTAGKGARLWPIR